MSLGSLFLSLKDVIQNRTDKISQHTVLYYNILKYQIVNIDLIVAKRITKLMVGYTKR